jgi:hypothetical protein
MVFPSRVQNAIRFTFGGCLTKDMSPTTQLIETNDRSWYDAIIQKIQRVISATINVAVYMKKRNA